MKLEDGTEVFTQEELEARLDEETKGLKANQKAALDEAKAAKAAAKELRETWGDLDADEVRKLLSERAKAESEKAKAQGDWESREKQLTDAHAKERAKWEADNGKLKGSLRKAIVTAKLTEAITKAKGDPEYVLHAAEQYVDVTETDDGYEAYVTDGQGNKMFSDGEGTPMGFGELVESRLIPKFPRAFDGTGSSGSGASRSAGGAGGGQKTVSADDGDAFLSNIEGIASGEVAVR